MKKAAKYLRSIPVVNKLFRYIFKSVDKYSDFAIVRWPVVGEVKLQFDDIPFNMYSKGDDTIVQLLYYNKTYHEQKDLKLFLHFVRKANVIFDIGANTGVYSILSAKANPAAQIYSFEPYPVNIKRLKRNFRLNHIEGTVIEKALGSEQSLIQFAVPEDNSIADTSSAEVEFSKNTYDGSIKWKSIEVEQITLDSFIQDKNFDHINLIKIDVEGYEESVFRGAVNFFKKYSPIVQCEILLNEKKKVFFEKFLQDNNYTAYLILSDGLLNIGKSLIPNPGSMNYIFSPINATWNFHSYSEIEELVNQLLKT